MSDVRAVIAGLCLGSVCWGADTAVAPRGELVFHRYSDYEAWDGKLYLHDLATGSLRCLSDQWTTRPVEHAMNAHFLPGGRHMVFMGVRPGKHVWNEWDIFLWDMQSGQDPVDLTADNMMRDEDPKFSPDGTRIVFKQDGRIRVMGLDGRMLDHITDDPAGRERSMPYYWGSSIVCMEGAGTTGDLSAFDITTSARTVIAAAPGLQEYYPIAWDADRLLYARWISETNRNDQLYAFDRRDGRSSPLSFCTPAGNYSDPYPIDARTVVFSGTLPGGHGGYDLYLGDAIAGTVTAVSGGSINGMTHELGSCYRAAVGHPPVAQAQAVSTAEDVAKNLVLSANDPDGDALTYTVVAGPTHGSLSGTGANRIYTPDAHFNGSDSFSFRVQDGTAESAVAVVSITVTAVNDAPVAIAQSVSTGQGMAKSITLTGTDVDGGTLVYATGSPTHGLLSGTGALRIYTPTAGYSGPDSFTFTASDGVAVSAAATITISVVPTAVIPSIATQPTGITVTSGATATFSVVASGTPAPSYQWQRNGTDISGATASSYTTPPVVWSDSGAAYRVVVTNSAGSVTSETAVVTVLDVGVTLPTRGDIGVVARPGSTAVAGGVWTLTGHGGNLWGSSDGFQMASQVASGDVRITARIDAITTTNSWARAGVMIRAGRTATAPYAMCMNTAAIGSAFQRRLVTGAGSSYTVGPYVRPPTWVRIERTATLVVSSVSVDGLTWKEIGRQHISMPAILDVGLFVTGHSGTASCTATFSNVQIVAAPVGGG